MTPKRISRPNEQRKVEVLLLRLAKMTKAVSGKSAPNWRRSTRRLTDTTRELKITVRYELTGEEKEMFGCLARHWIIRRRDEHDKNLGEN